MKIHEYQAKELFAQYDIPINEGKVCYTVDEVIETYKSYNMLTVVKAQVHVGGRGKAGGVKLANTLEKATTAANNILGMDIKGHKVEKVLVAKAADIEKEYYVGYINDRNTKSAILMVSKEGGVDIEQVAAETPEKIFRYAIDPAMGMPDYLAREIAFKLFDDIKHVRQAAVIFQKLYKLYVEKDATLAEINPMILTPDEKVLAIDAKMTFDDNALYRHPEIEELREADENEKIELFAKSKGFSFVKLDGDIGCMVNGAGLAMATMDMIKLYGGEPANFLDIGGSSNPQKVVDAMNLLLEDKNVKVVMINIFGGITRCDDVARGLITAMEQIKTDIPVVVRLTGTNDKEGQAILRGTDFHAVETMSEAAQKAIELTQS
ncbi:ADP-forming succinate--CoA ligase subunit beta [Prolixibacteraceae bacterium JC049]|nr:ADP-forming succinate--CoA ligase subunit beta [Prolixibacteraceae bacterium JC049]